MARAKLLFVLALWASPVSSAEPAVDYVREIKPLLRARCYSCHGALKQEAGLRLDTGGLIRQGGDSGAAVDLSDVAASLLLEKVTAEDEGERMPPEGEPLSRDQIEQLRAWIESGAASPEDELPEEDPADHWAFKRPTRSEPTASDASLTNPIDRFIQARYAEHQLTPLPAASPEILLRRVYLDLIGLPPTRDQLHEFLSDPSPEAYRRVVDRLLSSEHHGERWGRHWMDVWRYSDWYGRRQVNDVRNSYPHIWRWRDWIINSLNDDKGYDQMVREMLAADELYPEDDERIAALGFIVRNWFSLNYDTWKQDLVEHTGKAFLGLRINCAHCHDHKYDPISQEEYFQFRAFFEPLEFRHDRVPGGPPLTKYIRYNPGSGSSLAPIEAGLARVYDHYFDEPTHMYRLGDARDRFERPPVAPGGLAILGGDDLTIEAIKLPTTAWYPGLKPFAVEAELETRQTAIRDAQSNIVKADAAVAEANAQLAAAEKTLADARAKAADEPMPAPRSQEHVVGWWRFEGADGADGFLADSSGNDHALHRVSGGAPDAKPFTLKTNGRAQAFRIEGSSDLPDNQQAAEFQQNRSFGYLAASGSSEFYSNGFTLEALVHFDISQRNYNRTIADYDGCWTLLHRGLDDKTFELRVRYFSDDGQLRDVATSDAKVAGGQTLVLDTGHDYYVCLLMAEQTVTLWAADLTTGAPLESFQFPRHTAESNFGKLRRPDAATPFKIGNSDGTGRVDGLIDEVRYTRSVLSIQQIAAAVGQSSDADVQRATVALARARTASDLARLAKTAGDAALAAGNAELKSLEARIKADRAKHAGADSFNELATAAGSADRVAKLATARAKLAEAERQSAELRSSGDTDQKKRDQAAQDAKAAQAAIASLEAGKPSPEYSPLGPEYPQTSTGRRAALANWMASKDNPLTARVAVNHIWMRHFRKPLVDSVFDFGRAGKRPTHPQLLDWLAVELMDNGWSMKHVHRLIVTSDTYRRTSRPPVDHPNHDLDEENRWYWKFDRRRLEAEIVRDSLLHVSGQLDAKLGGQDLDPKQEAETRRRSLYYTVYPEAGGLLEFMTLFDPPDPGDCYRRSDSIVPQQALALSNSRLSFDQGQQLTKAISDEVTASTPSGNDDASFVNVAFERVLSRRATTDEQQVCLEFLAQQLELYKQADDQATPADMRQRARESLVRTLLNHNDFITVH